MIQLYDLIVPTSKAPKSPKRPPEISFEIYQPVIDKKKTKP
jgi:hypothetical protein